MYKFQLQSITYNENNSFDSDQLTKKNMIFSDNYNKFQFL